MLDNVARGRKKHVWVSTSTDLLNDAQRDIRDLGMLGVRVIDGPQELDKSRATPTEGVLFTTYSTLTSGVTLADARALFFSSACRQQEAHAAATDYRLGVWRHSGGRSRLRWSDRF